MKILSWIRLVVIFILFTSFSGPESKKYQVEIVQDGQLIPIVDNIALLEKKEFQIKITLYNHEGVFMSSSFNRDYFDLRDDQEIKDYRWLNLKSIAEEEYNKDKELVVDDELVSFLFYDKKMDWHRFDENIVIDRNIVIATKTINKVLVHSSNQEITINQIDNNIYLFFVATEEWNGDVAPKELGRKKIELRWK